VALDDLPAYILQNYEIHEWRHASAVLARDFPHEWDDIIGVLTEFRLRKSAIAIGGGNKSKVADEIDAGFRTRGWVEKQFQTEIVVDGEGIHAPTHQVDEYKNHVAVEMEWNNKDPFFDRDLNNFRLLFDLRAISVGVIITRCDELQEIFNSLGRGSSYGMATTHMSKLLPKLEGGGGGGCTVLVFGIKRSLYIEDV
jgi:hypothetical protein